LKLSQLTKLLNIPKKSYQIFFHFMWNQKPLEEQSSEWCFHVDDLVLLSEFDDVTSAVTAAWNFTAVISYTKRTLQS